MNKMDIIVHVGFPKVASTWIQKEFIPKIRNFDIVPRSDIKKYIIRPSGKLFDKHKSKVFFETNFKNNMILSDEVFLNGSYYYALRNAVRIKKIFSNAKIWICIRRQTELLASLYMSYIRRGGTQNIDIFLSDIFTRTTRNEIFNPINLFEYKKIIKVFSKLFGDENIKILYFEKFIEDSRMVANDIAHHYNFEIDLNSVNFNPVNISYRDNTKKLALFLNRFNDRRSLRKSEYYFNIPFSFKLSNIILHHFNKSKLAGKKLTSIDILGEKNFKMINDRYHNYAGNN